jgi:hypothetical protein
MFEKLKTFFSGLSYAWKYGDVLRNVTTAWSQFPGWEDSELLRLWIRPLVQNASMLTALTKTPIDDVIAAAAIRIIDSNTSWAAVYALAQLVRDGQRAVASQLVLPYCCNNSLPLVANVDKPTNGRRFIEGEADCGEAARFPQSIGNDISVESIACDACPECPAVGLTALGIILYLLQQRN